jgi:hypothetical protein
VFATLTTTLTLRRAGCAGNFPAISSSNQCKASFWIEQTERLDLAIWKPVVYNACIICHPPQTDSSNDSSLWIFLHEKIPKSKHHSSSSVLDMKAKVELPTGTEGHRQAKTVVTAVSSHCSIIQATPALRPSGGDAIAFDAYAGPLAAVLTAWRRHIEEYANSKTRRPVAGH